MPFKCLDSVNQYIFLSRCEYSKASQQQSCCDCFSPKVSKTITMITTSSRQLSPFQETGAVTLEVWRLLGIEVVCLLFGQAKLDFLNSKMTGLCRDGYCWFKLPVS